MKENFKESLLAMEDEGELRKEKKKKKKRKSSTGSTSSRKKDLKEKTSKIKNTQEHKKDSTTSDGDVKSPASKTSEFDKDENKEVNEDKNEDATPNDAEIMEEKRESIKGDKVRKEKKKKKKKKSSTANLSDGKELNDKTTSKIKDKIENLDDAKITYNEKLPASKTDEEDEISDSKIVEKMDDMNDNNHENEDKVSDDDIEEKMDDMNDDSHEDDDEISDNNIEEKMDDLNDDNHESDDSKKDENDSTTDESKIAVSDNDNSDKDEKHDDNIMTDKKEKKGESLITTTTFVELGCLPIIADAATLAGWKFATRIQRDTLTHAFAGRDVIGLAETGSGKTGAFAIPIIQSLLQEKAYRKSIYAVVLAPTRELAFQIQEVFKALGSGIPGFTSICVVGGVNMPSQAVALAKLPHVVIATPGRLLDHLENTKGITLRYIKYLILDEADRMLSLDFEEEINHILSVLPDSTEGRKTMLFSATMTSKVDKLQRASLSNPIRVEVSTKFQTPETLLQYYLFIPAKYKDCYFTYLISECGAGKCILVFASTCNTAQRLAYLLRNLGMSAICLHGQMNQANRLGAFYKFKSGKRNILICTDIASRGLDIPSVDVVMNYDLPNHGKDYIHRVGRTARAGRSGLAYALVTQYDVEVYQRLENLLGKKLPEYKLDEEMVLILLERVHEAQRLAVKELKEQHAVAKDGKKRRGGFDDTKGGAADGIEPGVEAIIQEEFRKKGFERHLGGSAGNGGALRNQRGSGRNTKKYRHGK